MKSKNKLLIIGLIIVTIITSVLFPGCKSLGNRDKIILSEKTVNVRVYKGGYGTNWIYEMKDKFEETYQEEGYKINVLKPSSDISGNVVTNELMTGGNGIDLYISGPIDLGKSKDYLEDISETVWNKKPIKFDKTEEDVLYKDKIVKGMDEYAKADGKYLSSFYFTGVNGMVINQKKLDEYNLSVPNTTNELIDCFDTILTGKGTDKGNSQTSKIYPHTYLASANGYPTTYEYTLLAQYLGYEDYKKLITLEDNGTKMLDNGYEAYDNDDLIDVYEEMFKTFDQVYATDGIVSQDIGIAQAKVMNPTSGAVFYMCGDWFLNEEKKDFKNYLNDITFARYPVISALGKKLFGNGTDLNLSDRQADDLLSYIVGLVDNVKSVDEIISLVKSEKNYTISNSQVERIYEARGIYYNKGVEHQIFITKNAKAKDLACLFMRYMASDDAGKLILEESNGTIPFTCDFESNSQYNFVNNAAKLVKFPNAKAIFRLGTYDCLSRAIGEISSNVTPNITDYIAQYVSGKMISKYDEETLVEKTGCEDIYRNAASSMINTIKLYVKDNWQSLLKKNNLI